MSKVNTQHLAQLIERIGGKDNITTVSDCLTRLRFVLAEPALDGLPEDTLKALEIEVLNADRRPVVNLTIKLQIEWPAA